MKRLMIACGGKRIPRFTIEISFLGVVAIVLMVMAVKNLYGGGGSARYYGITEMAVALVLALFDTGFWRPRS